MIRVLFCCHGNICRSPMAEFLFKNMVEELSISDQFFIASAATSTEEIGNPVHYGTRNKLRQLGIDCSGKRAVQLQKKDYARYDYLIGMDSWNIRNMLRMLGEIRKERCSACWILRSGRELILRTRGIQEILKRLIGILWKACVGFYAI